MFYCRYKWYRTCDSAMYGQQLDISKVFCCQHIRQMENELSEIGTLKYESDRAENIVNRVCWKEVRLYEILYVWGHPETPLRQAIAYVYRMLSSARRTHNRCKPNQLDFCFFIVTGGSEFYHLWLRAKKKKKMLLCVNYFMWHFGERGTGLPGLPLAADDCFSLATHLLAWAEPGDEP